MTSQSDYYLFTLNNALNQTDKILVEPNGLNLKPELKYDNLVLWTFNHEKFQINWIQKKKANGISFSFGKCDQLRSLLLERRVSTKIFDILTIEKTHGYPKNIKLILKNELQAIISGGYGHEFIDDIEENRTIAFSGYSDAYHNDPFKGFKNEPELLGSEAWNYGEPEPEILNQWKSIKRNESKWSFFGCLTAILLYGGGTILLFLLVFFILTKCS